MWLAPKKPAYRLAAQAIPLQGLGSLLHPVAERTGRRGFVNLIQVATAFVNEQAPVCVCAVVPFTARICVRLVYISLRVAF